MNEGHTKLRFDGDFLRNALTRRIEAVEGTRTQIVRHPQIGCFPLAAYPPRSRRLFLIRSRASPERLCGMDCVISSG